MPPFDTTMAHRHKKGLSATQARQWAHVATSVYAACTKDGGSADACEARAIRAANSRTGEPDMASEQAFQTIVAHIATSTTRRERLDGREYLVARVVPIVEAVLNDYLIPAEEIAACLPSWSDLPLPIGHPQNEYGDYISGKSPMMLERSIGRFFSPTMDGPRLVGEVWLDIAKCQQQGGDAAEVLRRVEANEIVEVSTAFYPQTAMQQGVFNGTPYRGVHRSLRPDHLALLPHGIGACHAGMGCGIRAQGCACDGACTCEKGAEEMSLEAEVKHPGKLRQALRTLFAFANGAESDEETQGEDGAAAAPAEEGTDETPALQTHLTHDDLRMALSAAIKAGRQDPYRCMIHDIEDTFVIYSEGEQVYRRAYTVGANQAVALSGEPEAVQRVTTYVPATMPPREEAVTTYEQKGLAMLTKPELITRLVAHEHTAWTEEQTPTLQAFDERMLEQLLVEADRRGEEAPLTLNALKKHLKEELEARDHVFDTKLKNFAQQAEERAEREQIIGYLVTQQGWKQDEAAELPLTALRQIHRMADPVSYIGQGMPRYSQESVDESLPSNEPDWS